MEFSSSFQLLMISSKKPFSRALFIFRRDLRLDDNTGLLHALNNAETVVPVFIFDKKQIDPEKNKYFGSNCVQFMCESLRDLDSQLQTKGSHLNCYYGQYPDIIQRVLDAVKPDLLCLNMDYTIYSKERDAIIEKSCGERTVQFKTFEDITLLTKEQACAGYEGDVFAKKFTPFYNRVLNHKINKPEECKQLNFSKSQFLIEGFSVKDFGEKFYQLNEKLEVRGGRSKAVQILGDLEEMKKYSVIRDDPSKKTTQLSAYNKFGCVSIREVYHRFKTALKEKADPLTRQLYWRDFYYFIAEYYPHIFSGPMKPSYSRIPWEDNPEKILAWQEGRTGCPIIDASMRHMNTVGFMPNRCRMIVSNYLVKDLHVNWQVGERYFANKLVDYDPAQNNGGWQWSAGCGVDSQPYFRIFNPVLQMQKFDPECKYIKRWVPELKEVPAEDIHNWEKSWEKHHKKTGYPKPIVIHQIAKDKIVEMYKKSFEITDKLSPEELKKYGGSTLSDDPKVKVSSKKKNESEMDEEEVSLKPSKIRSVSRKNKGVEEEGEVKGRTSGKTKSTPKADRNEKANEEITSFFSKKVKKNDDDIDSSKKK